MLRFLCISENNKEVIYKYYPENEEQSGLICVEKKSGECNIIKLSTNDRHKRYAIKLFRKLREFANNSEFEKEGIMAWS